jgi:hypothetical protein
VAHFLLVYDKPAGALLRIEQFEDLGAALIERFAEEARRRSSDIEVVVLSARSRAELERTHSRYFLSVDELLQRMGAVARSA